MVALHVGQRSLPRYAHRFAPKKFTLPQLFACLVLKAFEETDYRGIVAKLQDNPTLCADLGLKAVPHFTTLQKAAVRLLRFQRVRRLLDATVRGRLRRRRRIRRSAVDATGFEAGRISPYFVRRRDRSSGRPTTSHYTRFPKLHAIWDCHTHLILAMYPTRGPTPDVHQLRRTLEQLVPSVTLDLLLADPGYDSEANHLMLREQYHARTLIPPRIGRPTTKLARGRYRRLMQRLFQRPDRTCYGQRWQSETGFSMIKRNLTHAIASKTYWNQCRDMMLLGLTHNIMILQHRIQGFLRNKSGPLGRRSDARLLTSPAQGDGALLSMVSQARRLLGGGMGSWVSAE